MPTSKRASMREGPLAALFRKTAEDAPGAEKPEEKKRAAKPREEPGASTRAPSRPAAPPARQVPEPAGPERHVPSPQERLRQAFAADIPESLMERPKPERPPAADPYARPDRTAESFAAPEA